MGFLWKANHHKCLFPLSTLPKRQKEKKRKEKKDMLIIKCLGSPRDRR
jgi:hypothetical protein